MNFSYLLWNYYAIVVKFLYDPNRTAPLMLLCYLNGILSYHLATKDSKIGDFFFIGKNENFLKKNTLLTSQVCSLTEGILINNIENLPTKGTKFVKAAGTSAQLLKIDKKKRRF